MNTQDMFEQIFTAARTAESSGQIPEAERLCAEAFKHGTSYDALLFAAKISRQIGNRKQEALYIKEAFKIQPSAALRLHLIVAYSESGDLDQAAREAQEGIAKKPKDFALTNAYGVILKLQGHYKEAINLFTRATRLDPSNVMPWVNLGNTWIMLDNPRRSVDCFFKATRLAPREGEFYRLLAGSYSRLKDNDKALRLLQQAIVLSPQNPQARIDIARVYMSNKEYMNALKEVEHVLEQFPNNVEALRDKGLVLRLMGNINEAKLIYEYALRSYPNHVKLLLALGNLYQLSFGDTERANEYLSQAYHLDPKNREVVASYVESLLNSRYGNEANHIDLASQIMCNFVDTSEAVLGISAVAQSVFLRGTDFDRLSLLGNQRDLMKYWVESNTISALHNQISRVKTLQDRFDLLEAHRNWGKQIEARAKAYPISSPAITRLRPTKTRIGLMSSDLRRHNATSFVSPLLEFYDRSKFELFCYSFSLYEADEIQQWVAKTVDHFSCWPNLPDREIAQRIASDGLDMLFELGGTTHMNKVEVMAWKPAPIQASWLGYPHSSGLEAIDYFVVDPWMNPERSDLLIEKPFCLPETCVILGNIGFLDIPIAPGIPEDHFQTMTFGTMNNPTKYTPQVFEAWSRILKEVSNSTFHIVRPECGSQYFCKNVLIHFARHGIAADRIKFTAIRGKHLPFYNEIDIALDTFPQTGGATTCEALWMGVPTITLVGPAFYERLSYSNLNNAGLGDLCAFDIDSYVNKSVSLASDKKRRKDLRHSLRQQIRSLPLGQMERFAYNFESMVEKTLSSGNAL